jgi:hypothetical protein
VFCPLLLLSILIWFMWTRSPSFRSLEFCACVRPLGIRDKCRVDLERLVDLIFLKKILK